MKNILVIDEAPNCAYDIYEIDDDIFAVLFPFDGQNIEFIEDVIERLGSKDQDIFANLWGKPVIKNSVNGIHGTLFYGLIDDKKRFYPNKKDSDLDGWARGWISAPEAPPVNTPEFMKKLLE